MVWQLQEAKQKFSEIVRAATRKGPQIVTRHGEEVAVVISMDDYRRMSGRTGFKDHLLSGPRTDGLDIQRAPDHGRETDLGG